MRQRALPTFVCLTLALIGLLAPAAAQADRAFGSRYATTARGDLTLIGNTLMTCPGTGAPCPDAQSGAVVADDNNFVMDRVDVDGDGTTFDSSAATATLPAGSTVLFAGLYWGADTSAGASGAAAPNAAAKDTVRFKVGTGAYQTLTAAAADVYTSTLQPTRYQAFKDVTSLVSASGTYTLANVQSGTGTDRYAGWSMVIAYRDATRAIRRLNVYDGLGSVGVGSPYSTTLTGFHTTAASPTAKFGMIAYEGDRGLTGETVKINGQTVSDAFNPADNFFNSTFTVNGARFTAKTPNYENQLGYDADFNSAAAGTVPATASSATLDFTSSQDVYMPGVFLLASDEGPATNTAPPVVSGIARDGQLLTATTGTWDGTPTITYAYEWQRCDSAGAACAPIAGATGPTYSLTSADVGSRVRVLVTATNDAGSASAPSSPTALVAAAPPVNTVLPSFTGTERDGQTLTANNGTWTGTAPLTYTYVWQSCDSAGANCAAISGATASTYTLTSAEIGRKVRVAVTATNAAGNATAVSATSGAIAARPPANVTAPVVSGTVQHGQTLTSSNGEWTGTAPLTFTYQWQRCDSAGAGCVDIAGATANTYTLVAADVGARMTVRVTATNSAGNANASSAPTSAVAPAPPVNTSVPTITGTPRDGSVLTGDRGTWTGTDPITYTTRWQRCDSVGANCIDITGATNPTYTASGADIGSRLRVVYTATNAAGNASATSAPTAVVTVAPPVNTNPPAVSGTPRDGDLLSSVGDTWSGTTPMTFAYQWRRCNSSGASCVDIAGATAVDYRATGADIGSTLRVRVTAANAGGSTPQDSPASTVVVTRPPANVTVPTISGTPRDGQTLTSSNGTWTGTTPLTYAYQWTRCDSAGANCVDIAGATASTYTLVTGDVDARIRVRVTASNAAGNAAATSLPTALVTQQPPAFTAVPVLSGTARDGQTLTGDNGTVTGSRPLTYTYAWERCNADGSRCVFIPGATSATRPLGAADVGKRLRITVTATNVAGTASATSALSSVVAPTPPVNGIAPSQSGSARDGQTLTADPGVWSGTAPITYAYQWQRCDASGSPCADMTGATGQTLTLTSADIGNRLRVVVTATNAAGSANASSTPTSVVVAAAPVAVDAPAITGTPVDGRRLSAAGESFTGTQPITVTMQWLRCDGAGTCSPIAGATGRTYDLVAADIGSTIKVRATGTNSAGSDSISSAATGTVAPAAPVNSVRPVVSGTPRDGSNLTVSQGTWTGTDPISYAVQWKRCDVDGTNCVDISGATSSTYTAGPADVGKTIRVIETATNAGGSTSATSARTGVVAGRAPVNVDAPVLSGEPAEGEQLTSSAGDWDGTAPLTTSVRWQRCDADGTGCTDIPGATGTTYRLVAADAGHVVRSMATASNVVGNASEPSRPSAVVRAKPAPPEAPAPTPEAPAPTPDPVVDPEPTSTPEPPPAPVATADDLGDLPGSLVNETACQQMVGGSVFKRLKLPGLGDVRLRAYSLGAAVPTSPLKVTTEVKGARSVTYSLDGRALPAVKGATFLLPIGPAALRKAGVHTLRATVLPAARTAKAATLTLTMKTVKCTTLLSVQRWRTTAGTGLRLRVDSRTAVRKLAFRMPAALLARQGVAPRAIGTIRFVSAGGKKTSQTLTLPKRGGAAVLLKGAGKPTVSYAAGVLTVDAIPERTGVVELTTYREVKRDGMRASRAAAITALLIPTKGAVQRFKGTARGVRGR